jgi:antitoxin component of MazEF toxin-antitoxin module
LYLRCSFLKLSICVIKLPAPVWETNWICNASDCPPSCVFTPNRPQDNITVPGGDQAHTVCIPRRWVEKLGFTKNDMVRMELLDNKIMIKRMDMELIRRYSDPTTIDMMKKFANSPGEGIHMEKVLME